MRVCLSLFMCVIVFSRWVALVTEWQSPGVDGETATKSLFWAPTYSSPVPPITVLPLLSLHANKTVLGIYWLQTKDGPDHSALWADTCILWGIAAEHFRKEVFFDKWWKREKDFEQYCGLFAVIRSQLTDRAAIAQPILLAAMNWSKRHFTRWPKQ